MNSSALIIPLALLLLFAAERITSQQTFREQSTVDLLGNRNPIFNYMPNPGHVDVDQLDWYQENVDLREEEGWWHLFPYGPLYSDASLLKKPNFDRQIGNINVSFFSRLMLTSYRLRLRFPLLRLSLQLHNGTNPGKYFLIA